MAGMMYLGNQKVTPVIVQGGSAEPTGCVFRVPDNVTEISTKEQFESLYGTKFPYDVVIDLNNVETVSGEDAFQTSFVNINITSLKENVKTISGRTAFDTAFAYSTIPEESTLFENLETLSELGLVACFYRSKGKKIFRFKKLSYIGVQGFSTCFPDSSVEHIYFNSLTSSSFADDPSAPGNPDRVFMYMLEGVDGCTVHFPSNLESLIGEGSYVLSGFGGTNTTVLFDLPETE